MVFLCIAENFVLNKNDKMTIIVPIKLQEAIKKVLMPRNLPSHVPGSHEELL